LIEWAQARGHEMDAGPAPVLCWPVVRTPATDTAPRWWVVIGDADEVMARCDLLGALDPRVSRETVHRTCVAYALRSVRPRFAPRVPRGGSEGESIGLAQARWYP
jgi:hypothetical protein